MLKDLEHRREVELDKYVKAYAELEHYGSHGDTLRSMVDVLLAEVAGGSIVDLSCGRGAAMEIARKYFTKVRGTETVAELLGPDVEYALAHDLPFPDNAFDVALSTGVIEHLLMDDIPAAFSEMRRVASRAVVIVTNNKPSHYHITCPSYDQWDAIIRKSFNGWTVDRRDDCGLGGENRAWLIRTT